MAVLMLSIYFLGILIDLFNLSPLENLLDRWPKEVIVFILIHRKLVLFGIGVMVKL